MGFDERGEPVPIENFAYGAIDGDGDAKVSSPQAAMEFAIERISQLLNRGHYDGAVVRTFALLVLGGQVSIETAARKCRVSVGHMSREVKAFKQRLYS